LKVTRAVTLKAPPQRVWDVLLDPAEFSQCIPGVEAFEALGGDKYTVTMKIGIGAVKGAFSGAVAVRDVDLGKSYSMDVHGRGSAGFVQGSGKISLAATPEGATEVTVDGDANIGGTIAMVGQRMLSSAANLMVDRFFGCIGERL